MVKELSQRRAGLRPPRLLPVDAIERVRKKEQERDGQPRPGGNGVVGAEHAGGEVVVEEGGDEKVAHAAEEAHKGEEIRSHPHGTEVDDLKKMVIFIAAASTDDICYLVPKGVHDICAERTGVLAAVAIAIEAPEDVLGEVGVEHVDKFKVEQVFESA